MALSPASYVNRGGDGARRREIITPEGIPIQFTLASLGERATALMIDMLIMIGVIFGVAFVFGLASPGPDHWLSSLALLLSFLLRHFYFAYFEIRGHGATPGKRAAGIRVIDARGGSLESSAVLARNLVRELELWMPLTYLVILLQDPDWLDAPGWSWIVALTWIVLIALLPLFNKDNLRVGDLVGGTLVVHQPKLQLRPDLADQRRPAPASFAHAPGAPIAAPAARPAAPVYTFTEAQLGIYGVYELQVLEGVLRGEAAADQDAKVAVAQKIRQKIQFSEPLPAGQEERFLRDFYAALRGHLEKRMLFGKRRADKHDKT